MVGTKLGVYKYISHSKVVSQPFFVGQLCELGLDFHFSNHNVAVQDPLTGKLLGTGHKVGCLFELRNLQIPSHLVSSSVAATTLSLDL